MGNPEAEISLGQTPEESSKTFEITLPDLFNLLFQQQAQQTEFLNIAASQLFPFIQKNPELVTVFGELQEQVISNAYRAEALLDSWQKIAKVVGLEGLEAVKISLPVKTLAFWEARAETVLEEQAPESLAPIIDKPAETVVPAESDSKAGPAKAPKTRQLVSKEILRKLGIDTMSYGVLGPDSNTMVDRIPEVIQQSGPAEIVPVAEPDSEARPHEVPETSQEIPAEVTPALEEQPEPVVGTVEPGEEIEALLSQLKPELQERVRASLGDKTWVGVDFFQEIWGITPVGVRGRLEEIGKLWGQSLLTPPKEGKVRPRRIEIPIGEALRVLLEVQKYPHQKKLRLKKK